MTSLSRSLQCVETGVSVIEITMCRPIGLIRIIREYRGEGRSSKVYVCVWGGGGLDERRGGGNLNVTGSRYNLN